MATTTDPLSVQPTVPTHAAWLRLTHWLNVVAVLLMVASGWGIYNASPFFPLRFPREVTLGGWLGGALQWHFAGMWLLAINGIVYLACNAASGRFVQRFLPLSASQVWRDLRSALRGKLAHADPSHYNAVQRLAYLFAVADLLLLALHCGSLCNSPCCAN